MAKETERKKRKREMTSKLLISMGFFMAALVYLFLVLSSGYYLIQVTGAFVGNWHNVDLAMNAANQGCGQCLGEITDHGINMGTGEHDIMTLEDAYVESTYRMRRQFYVGIWVSFLTGVFLCVGIRCLLFAGRFFRETDEAEKRYKEVGGS